MTSRNVVFLRDSIYMHVVVQLRVATTLTGILLQLFCCICCCCHCIHDCCFISLSCLFSKNRMSLPTIPSSVPPRAGGRSASNKLAKSIGVNLYNATISIIHESDKDEGEKDNSDDNSLLLSSLTFFWRGKHNRKAQVLKNTVQEEIQRIKQVVDTFSWPFH